MLPSPFSSLSGKGSGRLVITEEFTTTDLSWSRSCSVVCNLSCSCVRRALNALTFLFILVNTSTSSSLLAVAMLLPPPALVGVAATAFVFDVGVAAAAAAAFAAAFSVTLLFISLTDDATSFPNSEARSRKDAKPEPNRLPNPAFLLLFPSFLKTN